MLLKPGRSDAASRIAVAHTGAITGSDAVTDAFLEDLGVIRVDSVEELAETAGVLARRGWPRGDARCSSGSPEERPNSSPIRWSRHRFSRTVLERSARATLRHLQSPQSVIHNPFGVTVDAMSHYPEIVGTIAASGEFDIVVSQGVPKRSFEAAAGMMSQTLDENAIRSHFKRASEQYGVFGHFHETGDHQPGIGVFSRTPPNGSFFALGRNGVLALSNSVDYGLRRVEAARLTAAILRFLW